MSFSWAHCLVQWIINRTCIFPCTESKQQHWWVSFYHRQNNILYTCLSGTFVEITGDSKMLFVSIITKETGHWSFCTIDYLTPATLTIHSKNGLCVSVSLWKDNWKHTLGVYPCTFASNWVRTNVNREMNRFCLKTTVFSLFTQKIGSFEVHQWHSTNAYKFYPLLR